MSAVTWRCEPFERLSVAALYRILAARQEVFVVEQTCPYLDADGRDPQAEHLWAEDEGGAVLAYARLFAPGVRHAEACIGRVITTAAARGRGLGRALMWRAIERCTAGFGPGPIRIGAQLHLDRFYREFGFEPVGAPYDEDGIPHIEMVRR